MTRRRMARPRRLGLLTQVDRGASRVARRTYPYSIGDRIAGDLTVIGHLAVGRLGHLYQVWSARDWCAYTCKILAPELRERSRAAAALRREARILKIVRHPNIIRSYGGGEHDGLPYLLMEYAEGPSIFDLLESRPGRRIGVSDAVRTAIHVGAAIYHLHTRGFLHLDLKPANLLLRGSVPLLVDFDAARRSGLARRPLKSLGTAPYMAPEQVLREAPTVASDVYGLGAVLYEMLTGRWPFEDVYVGEEMREGEEHDFPQIGASAPPVPSQFNADIPRELDEVVMRCLEREPTKRFNSMHPLLLNLVEQLEDPVALWPTGVQAERRREPRDG